ncbi:DUF6931 family protein [Paracoccus saliphilus]|uniref:Uncharacterized protein n=1 Tax=Paracoccus saliphilus TaxID=405559 RepID=A0AA45W1G8_9RHOB|nr:hypothetical protein [Paracoccus saliphilus]WCR03636.1 hypothetical protein JHX88_02340 [Paracoccus saliphilus]SIS57046.1 hypothetical protein SAMN05421772_101544 [Paracoccus saliphilus]
MSPSDQDDTTERPRRTLREEDPRALFVQLQSLADLVKLSPREDEDGLRFLARLRASTTPEEAVTYTAFAALPTNAAGWGYECLRLMADHLHPQERPMMQKIAAWLANPTTRLRHDIMKEALWAPARGPSVLLGLAVGWSTGKPAPNDPEPAPAHKAPVAINSAVLSCLARVPLSQRSVYLARILDMAESLFRAY